MTRKIVLSVALWMVVFAVFPLSGQAQTWLDTDWSNRRPVAVANPSGALLADFQVRITLDSSFSFTGANSDGSDIRVTAADGVTLIPFWIENWNPGASSASLWVRVPSIPAAGTTVYLYYGNTVATTASTGTATFEFFDDFDSSNGPQAYFELGGASTSLVADQAWETSSPHTLSVVERNTGGHRYWGYYSLQAGCGGVGLTFSEDLVNWTKHAGNPVIPNGRWASVIQVGGTLYMAYTKDYCTVPQIMLASSTDGLTWTDVKPLVTAGHNAQSRNQNPNLWRNPNDGQFYLYWYNGNDSNIFNLRARSAALPTGLDSTATEVNIVSSASILAAPNMMYYGGTYYLATEIFENNTWATRVYASTTSPTNGFSILPNDPVLGDNSACMFQHIFGNTLHVYYCKIAGNWVVDHRSADLSAGAPFGLDPAKWTSSGGSWTARPDTQQDGTTGSVARGTTTGSQLSYSNFTGTDYILEAYGKQVLGRVWGLGFRVSDPSHFYSLNLYEDLDGGQNLWSYSWLNGTATPLGSGAAGPVNLNTWQKLSVKVQGSTFDVFKDDVLVLHTANGAYPSGGIALYGEAGTSAHFNNALVRKFAISDPSTIVGSQETAPSPPSPAILESLTITPASVVGGNFATGTIVLTQPAAAGGTVVKLSSKPGKPGKTIDLPASVIVPAGQTSASFTIMTEPVRKDTSVTINATLGRIAKSASLTVIALDLTSISVDPSVITGTMSATGTVTLSSAAPKGGIVVKLSDNNKSLSMPPNVKVPEGATSATFKITRSRGLLIGIATISATYDKTEKSTTLLLVL